MKFKVCGVMQFEAVVEVEAKDEREAVRKGIERLKDRDYDYRDKENLRSSSAYAYKPER